MRSTPPSCIAGLLALTLGIGASAEHRALEEFDGTWEGHLTYAMRSPSPASDASAYTVRVTIKANRPVQFEIQADGDTEWAPHPRYIARFRFERRPAMLAGWFLRSGRDKDGMWVEQQSLIFTKIGSATLLMHQLRVVTNLDLPPEDKDRAWSFLLMGPLKRAVRTP